MFRQFRIAVLLLILLCVATGAWLARVRSTDWDNTLWLAIYPINADDSAVAAEYIGALSKQTFAPIEEFMAREAQRRGLALTPPVRVELYDPVAGLPPELDYRANVLVRGLWSLRLRYWGWRAASAQNRPPPDIRMFVLYHDPAVSSSLQHSLGLQNGLLGVVHAFADRGMSAANNIVIAHEFLHTLGATDKYDPGDNRPLFPQGYAEPEREPRFPQPRTEVMAGRRMLNENEWEMPDSLKTVVIGTGTAAEINWPQGSRPGR